MLEQILTNPSYLQARADNTWWVSDVMDLVAPTWEECLENIAWSCMNPLNSSKALRNMAWVSYRADRIPLIKNMLSEIAQIEPANSFSAHLFFSMSKESQNYGRHEDDSDLWYWQMYGTTHWTIEGSTSTFEGMVPPGVWLYVPRHTYHTAIPQGARASLSFAQHYTIPRKPNKAF